MTLEDIRRECSDTARLLQPYIDGELGGDEADHVAKHLETCHPCRAAVQEQAWVRATLQGLERRPAPQALRAKILLGLDGVDQENATAAAEPARGSGRGLWQRLRDMGRGGLIMIPAGAAALALFVMARQGVLPGDPVLDEPVVAAGLSGGTQGGAATTPEIDVSRLVSDLQPQVGFPVQVARPALNTRTGVQLVGARLAPRDTANAARQGVQVDYAVNRDERRVRVVDHQAMASGKPVPGVEVRKGDISYRMTRDAAGRPWVRFERAAVAHRIGFEGASPWAGGVSRGQAPRADAPDFAVLLHVAHLLASQPPALPPGSPQ